MASAMRLRPLRSLKKAMARRRRRSLLPVMGVGVSVECWVLGGEGWGDASLRSTFAARLNVRGWGGVVWCGVGVLVAVAEEAAELAEDAAFVAGFAAGLGGAGVDSAGEAGEGEGLEPDFPGSGEGGEEEAFAAKEGVFDAAGELDVVVDVAFEGDDAASVDAEGFAGVEGAFHDGPAGVDDGEALAGEALHDEAFAAEETDAEFFLEGDADLDAAGGADEGVFLADDFAAVLVEEEGDHLAGVRGGEGDGLRGRGDVLEGGDEDGFTGEDAFSGGGDFAEEALVGLRGVAEDGVHFDAGFHVHHHAGFTDDGAAGVEGDLGVLHFAALDLVVDGFGLLGGVCGEARRGSVGHRRRRGGERSAGGLGGAHAVDDGGDVPGGGPVGQAGAEDESGGGECGVFEEGFELVGAGLRIIFDEVPLGRHCGVSLKRATGKGWENCGGESNWYHCFGGLANAVEKRVTVRTTGLL